METLMVVTCDPMRDRDSELNDWYTWVHIRDVMRMPGAISAQRFVRSPVQPKSEGAWSGRRSYLALYEIGDKEACTRSHREDVFTDRMPISTAFSYDEFYEAYYDPLISSGNFTPETANYPVLVVGFNVHADRDGSAAEIQKLVTAVTSQPGIAEGRAFTFGTDQMLRFTSDHDYLLVCSLDNASLAVASWDRFASDLPSVAPLVASQDVHTAAYLPLMKRLLPCHVREAPG